MSTARGREDYDDESSCSSSNSESSFSSADSSSSLSDQIDAEQGYQPPSAFQGNKGSVGAAAVRRRMPPTSGNGQRSASEPESDPDDGIRKRNYTSRNANGNGAGRHHHHRHRHHHHHRQNHHQNKHDKAGGSSNKCKLVSHLRRVCRKNNSTILKQIPTLFLIGCFVFWLLVQTSNVYDSVSQSTRPREERNRIARRKARDNSRPNPPPPPLPPSGTTFSFLSDAVEGFMEIVSLPVKVFHQTKRGEGLLPGCVRSPWQVHNLQNCNDLHETDLYEVFSGRVQKDGGFVGSGYWRHVWLLGDNRGEAVLKMMKSEHKVETRNFERHRRDALAMERLTSSKHIVDIYAYCGNSVLTEYVGSDMHQVLYHADDDETTVSKQQTGPRTDRDTLQLALQVVQGVADLHQVPGGPIVHADIADKQFLVDGEGNVKLNDFNRCRFMGHKKTTKEKCTFRIPSAPGRHRSPEEYEDKELTERLDTYSTANVLYGILTSSPPWADMPSSQVKRAVKHGLKPPIDEEFRTPGTAKALLAALIDQAYEHDPEVRITAPEMAEELKNALSELKE